MANVKIASPSYIVRDKCAIDLFDVMDKLSNIGFSGIEFLGFFCQEAGDVSAKLQELNLTALGNHVNYTDFINDIQGTIDFHKTVGCNYITVGSIPEDSLPGNGSFARTAQKLNQLGNICKENRIRLLYHNHGFELVHKVDGKYMLEVIMDETDPELLALEPDVGWMAIGGADPAYFLTKYQKRCPVIHLKDFYCTDVSLIGNVSDFLPGKAPVDRGSFEFRPVGYGVVNVPSFFNKVQACEPEWIVIDHDLAYERNSYEDLKVSLNYVKQLFNLHDYHL